MQSYGGGYLLVRSAVTSILPAYSREPPIFRVSSIGVLLGKGGLSGSSVIPSAVATEIPATESVMVSSYASARYFTRSDTSPRERENVHRSLPH